MSSRALGTNIAFNKCYFRINDEVALKYRVIERSEIDDLVAKRREGHLDVNAMASAFATTGFNMKYAMEKFRRDLPEVATYLEGLNNKIDLLIRLLMASGSQLPGHPTHDVNLSASGLSFKGTLDVPRETIVEVKLLFFPSFLFVVSYGHVVRCSASKEIDGFPYELAVEFSHLEHNDRELLIRHILQKESAMLREARLGSLPSV